MIFVGRRNNMLPIVGLIAPMVGKLIGKFLKNKGDKAKFLSELELKLAEQETMLIQSLTKSDIAQAEINRADAQSSNKFQSCWRPAIAWICVFGLFWQVCLPLISWGIQLAGHAVPALPELGGGTLGSITAGILGLGALRTHEKKTGVSK